MSPRTLTAAVALALLLAPQAGLAADVYQFRLNRGIYAVAITPGCEIEGQYTLTGAVIISPDLPTAQSNNIQDLIWAQGTLTVCTRFGDVAQEAAPIPLSVALLRNPDLIAVGDTVRFGVDPSPAAHMFTGVNPPNLAEVQRPAPAILVFRYYDTATGDLVLGPLTIELTDSTRLASTPGFDPARHLPIEILRIVYPVKWKFIDYDEEFSFRIVAFAAY
jgi:hypothetical protein